MNIEVTSRTNGIPQALRDYAQHRIATVERFGEEFENSEIILSHEHEEHTCEVILRRHRGDPFIAADTARDGRAAVDGCAAKLERQFLRFKEKHSHKGKRHRAGDQPPTP